MNLPQSFSPRQARVGQFSDADHPVLSEPDDEEEDYPLHGWCEVDMKLVDDENKLEAGWTQFVANTMQCTLRNCTWIGKIDCSSVAAGWRPSSSGRRHHLAEACASWAWVFHGTGGAFSFEGVCESVGLCPRRCRKIFKDQCEDSEGINNIVEMYLAGRLPGISDID